MRLEHKFRRLAMVLAAAVTLLMSGGVVNAGQNGSAQVTGVWMTQSRSEITIRACGSGFCGFISKVVVPAHVRAKHSTELAASGTNYRDELNKNPSLRSRPIAGLQVLTLDQQTGPNEFKGRIYNPEDGQTYAGVLQVLGNNRVKVSGCAMGIFCKGEVWQLARR